MDLTGKVAVITGGSSGIGAATAKLFASHGASVAIIGRDESRLLAVAASCEAARNNKTLVLQLDLTVDANCNEAIAKTVQTFGKIDILVNCAGKAGMTSLFDTTTEIFDELIALNLRVPYKMTQLCTPHLKITKGNIVNVFGAPVRVRPGFLPFAMIRDALERFTKTGAVELVDEGIRMNAVRPGITRTNFLSNLNVDDDHMNFAYDELAALVPNNIIILPEEIAATILFVVSDSCKNWIGSNVIIDGGVSSYN